MLTVFARSFMNATRIDAPHIREAPKPGLRKRRWLPESHWWRESPRGVDLNNL
ncbi:hypothetical protein [Ruegeria conchae]|uniref:Uncharacterized protein n=1 Tax=Ruegeria conchae TaxID=981384 RepID=A0A497Z256_9RHOB|nr:hypothetical protein [Ruegeria conchae]RLK00625.1 hypothetical protein CLV75_3617 [Ruegeria conchae]UWR02428.1 hypothetical protein K3740_15460 [Ruegeria conchae]